MDTPHLGPAESFDGGELLRVHRHASGLCLEYAVPPKPVKAEKTDQERWDAMAASNYADAKALVDARVPKVKRKRRTKAEMAAARAAEAERAGVGDFDTLSPALQDPPDLFEW